MMPKLLISAALLSLPFWVSGLAGLQDPPAPATDGSARTASEDELSLEQHMQRVKRYQRRLGRSLKKDDQGASALADLQRIQTHVLATKAMVPMLANDMPEAERPAFVRSYRRMMTESFAVLLKLELAVLDGQADAAQKLYKEFRQFESRGHKQFKR